MTAEKTALWDRLGRTDPKHTKPFQRAGGFKGTAIKPIYSIRRMTEEYGPCGVGWGIGEPTFQTVEGPEGEVLVYCTVSIWHGEREHIVFGVGGDKAVIKQASGLRSDDEAFKKAFTDAVTNALKSIGMSADIHMGLFDDSKYVNELRQEFAASGPDTSVSEDSKRQFLEECEKKIDGFDDEDRDGILRWWHSDEQRKARRDFGLSQAEVDRLRGRVVVKAKLPAPQGTS